MKIAVTCGAPPKPQGDGAQRMKPIGRASAFSQRLSPLPLASFPSIHLCRSHMLALVCFRIRKVRLCTCVSLCARAKEVSCQNLPPLGIVPLLLLVHPATGPRALRQPACLMARQPFPRPTHTGARRRSMPWASRLAASVSRLYLNLRLLLRGRHRTGTSHQHSSKHRHRRTDRQQRQLFARSALIIIQPLVCLTA